MVLFSPAGMRRVLIVLVCALLAMLTSDVTNAANVPWEISGKPIFKIARNQPLSELLREFAADQGIPATVSEQIDDTISGQFGPLAPREFIDTVTQSNGVVWYYDGHALFFYRSNEIVSDMLQVRSMAPDEILEKLERLDLVSDRFKIKTLAEHGLLYVSGPPRYLEIVSKAVESIENTSDAQVRIQMAIEVFPLRYAWAEDQNFVFSGQQVVIPGVASILRAIIGGGQGGGATGTQIGPLPVHNLPGLSGQGLKRRQNLAIAQAQQIAVDAQVAAAQSRTRVDALEQYRLQPRGEGEEDQIDALSIQVPSAVQADARLNAVIVRDARAKMEHYRRIIADLDKPSGLVHLEASIVDVDANAGFEFGPPYVIEWQDGNRQRTASFQVQNSQAGTIDPRSLVGNLQFRLLDGAVNEILAQFQALETDGRARFVARPSVLTINNVEAHLETTETFFVRVAGQEDVDLFDVTTGTMMRIIPHIVCEPTGRRVKLIVRIEDGQTTAQTVDGIPIISRNTLNTQAVLNEGESLLIGGLVREEVEKTENRVPWLGRCPGVVGQLFTRVNSQKRKFDRMVLIRPRIVDLPPPNVHVNAGLEPEEGFELFPGGTGMGCPGGACTEFEPTVEYESVVVPTMESDSPIESGVVVEGEPREGIPAPMFIPESPPTGTDVIEIDELPSGDTEAVPMDTGESAVELRFPQISDTESKKKRNFNPLRVIRTTFRQRNIQ